MLKPSDVREERNEFMARNTRDAGLTFKEKMERVMKRTLDRLHKELDERFARLTDTDMKFGLLLAVDGQCHDSVTI